MTNREKIGFGFIFTGFITFMGFLSYYGFSNGSKFAGIFPIVMTLIVLGIAINCS